MIIIKSNLIRVCEIKCVRFPKFEPMKVPFLSGITEPISYCFVHDKINRVINWFNNERYGRQSYRSSCPFSSSER